MGKLKELYRIKTRKYSSNVIEQRVEKDKWVIALAERFYEIADAMMKQRNKPMKS